YQDITTLDYGSPTDSAGNPYVKPADNKYTYTWSVPSNQAIRSNYRIEARSVDSTPFPSNTNGTDYDVTDADFSIVASGTNLPDLVISDFSWTPIYPRSTDNITATVKIKNIGSAPAQNFSVTNFWDSNNKEIVIYYLASGAEVTVQGSIGGLSIPGPNTVNMSVDVPSKVVESNENNNSLSKTINVSPTYSGDGTISLNHWDSLQLNNGYILYADGENVLGQTPYRVRFRLYDSKTNYQVVSNSPDLNIGDSWVFTSPTQGVSIKINAINVNGSGNALWSVNLTALSGSPTIPSIQILSPNGGEKLEVGKTYNINWNSTGVSNISILLTWYTSGGINSSGIAELSNNPGTYAWTVPSTINPGSNYKIRLYNKGGINNIIDDSDNYFSIVNATTTSFDSDSSIDYVKYPYTTITREKYPDLFIAGYGKGSYAGNYSSSRYIYGQQPNPLNPIITSDPYDTYYDHCYNENQLNEAYIQADGKLGAHGFPLIDTAFKCVNGALVERSQAAITVISPNGGEQWAFGDTVKIAWKRNWMPDQANGLVTVAIKKGDSSPVTLAQGVADASGYSFTVSTSAFIHGYDYKIVVTSNGYGANLSDESDNYFSIDYATATSAVKVVSPNNGEQLKRGVEIPVIWSAAGDANIAVVGQFKVDLYKGGVFLKNIAPILPIAFTPTEVARTNWKIMWTPDSSLALSGDYKIRVTNSSTGFFDESDNYFSIVDPQTN
ncbi:MAG: Ser-Thr-rich GPI-anchored membrane family protein, partial [Pedobacter sp.]